MKARTIWLAASFWLAACAGGQTGEEGAGACVDGGISSAASQPPLADGGPSDAEAIDAEALLAPFEGSHQVSVYWLSHEQYAGYVDPSDVERTELSFEIRPGAGEALRPEGCLIGARLPIELTLSSSDGRFALARPAWLITWLDGEGASVSDSPGPTSIALGDGHVLDLHIEAGEVTGRVQGNNVVGLLGNSCGFGEQLPLTERPAGAHYADAPLPSAMFEALADRQFEVDWGRGHRSQVTARVIEHSETACWLEAPYSHAQMGGEIELVDAQGARLVAGASKVNLLRCIERVPARGTPCFDFNVYAEGPPRAAAGDQQSAGERDDSGPPLIIPDVAALTGGASTSLERWSRGTYTLSMRVQAGTLIAPRLTITLGGSEPETLIGTGEAPRGP